MNIDEIKLASEESLNPEVKRDEAIERAADALQHHQGIYRVPDQKIKMTIDMALRESIAAFAFYRHARRRSAQAHQR